jgi:hypothetical protein
LEKKKSDWHPVEGHAKRITTRLVARLLCCR